MLLLHGRTTRKWCSSASPNYLCNHSLQPAFIILQTCRLINKTFEADYLLKVKETIFSVDYVRPVQCLISESLNSSVRASDSGLAVLVVISIVALLMRLVCYPQYWNPIKSQQRLWPLLPERGFTFRIFKIFNHSSLNSAISPIFTKSFECHLDGAMVPPNMKQKRPC